MCYSRLLLCLLLWSPFPSYCADGRDCICLSQLVYDIIIQNQWVSVTFVYDGGEGLLHPECLVKGGLVPRLWAARVAVAAHQYRPHLGLDGIYTQGAFVVAYSNATMTLLDQASEAGILDTTDWLLLLGEDKAWLPVLLNHAQLLNLFIDSDVLLATYSSCYAQLRSVYRVGPKGAPLVESIGVWSRPLGYQVAVSANKYDRRQNFRGYPMQGIGVKVFDFFTTYLPDGHVSGFIGDIVTILKRTHNFSLSYQTLEGYAYGKLVAGSSNTWTGMVGELQSRRADLTVSELSVTKERSEIITYTQPLFIISRKLFVSAPEDFKKKLLAYATPMDTVLYLCIFAVIAALAWALYLVERLRHYLLPVREEPVSLTVASWYMLSALLQQGCSTCPSGTSTRGIFWLGFFVSVIIYTSYSGTLVSHLAVEKPAALPFSDLRQLSRQTDWDAGVNRNDLFQVIASQTCVGSVTEECRVLQDVWNNVVMRSPENVVTSYKDGLSKVLNGHYVFIGVDVTTNYYIRGLPPNEACRVKELPGRYITGGIAIGLQHRSPFRRIFNKSLQRLREMGVVNKMALKWLSAQRSCRLQTTISANLADVAALFLILLAGIAASLMVISAEFAILHGKRVLMSQRYCVK